MSECDEDNIQWRGKWHSEKRKENGYTDAFQEQENGRHISFKFP